MDPQINKDVEDLKQLLKNEDYSSMNDFISSKSHKERMKLRQIYKQKYGDDLMSDLKSDFAGIYQKIILALFTDPLEYDIDSIYKFIKTGVSENIIIEIFVSRPDWYLTKIKDLYKKKYNIHLEEHIKQSNIDDFKKLLLLILECKRSTNQAPDLDYCKRLSDDFEQEESDNLTVDSLILNAIFIQCSPQELIIISREYHKSTQRLITESINQNFKGNVRKLLNAILIAKISPSEYYANLLHEAIEETMIDENMITRVIVTRSEIDLNQIKRYYMKLYGSNFVDDLKNNNSNEYINLLVELYNKH